MSTVTVKRCDLCDKQASGRQPPGWMVLSLVSCPENAPNANLCGECGSDMDAPIEHVDICSDCFSACFGRTAVVTVVVNALAAKSQEVRKVQSARTVVKVKRKDTSQIGPRKYNDQMASAKRGKTVV